MSAFSKYNSRLEEEEKFFKECRHMKRTKAQKQELKRVDQYFAKLKRDAKKSWGPSGDQPVIITRSQLRRFKKLAIYALEMELSQLPDPENKGVTEADKLRKYSRRLRGELRAIKRFPTK